MIIEFSLNAKDIQNAIKQANTYTTYIQPKIDKVISILAERGVKVAQQEFNRAIYDGDNDVVVTTVKNNDGISIVAKGQAVAFIEFGAGVTYAAPYAGNKPENVADIGTYGKGRGKQQSWGYYDDNENVVITKGNPPNMCLYQTAVALNDMVSSVIREVFNSDN